MANNVHVRKLKDGVLDWNEWRDSGQVSTENIDLFRADFSDIVLKETKDKEGNQVVLNLQGVTLHEVNFQNADLWGANFRGAKIYATNFNKAVLQWANFQDAIIHGAEEDLIDFRGANIIRADFTGADIRFVRFDDLMKCEGVRAVTCWGSQQFIRHVLDLAFIEEFKRESPKTAFLWKWSSNYGRSWGRLAAWCCFILSLFFVLFYLLKVEHALVTSIMAFTSFGFVDTAPHSPAELTLICIEAVLGYIMFGALVSLIASQMARRSG